MRAKHVWIYLQYVCVLLECDVNQKVPMVTEWDGKVLSNSVSAQSKLQNKYYKLNLATVISLDPARTWVFCSDLILTRPCKILAQSTTSYFTYQWAVITTSQLVKELCFPTSFWSQIRSYTYPHTTSPSHISAVTLPCCKQIPIIVMLSSIAGESLFE